METAEVSGGIGQGVAGGGGRSGRGTCVAPAEVALAPALAGRRQRAARRLAARARRGLRPRHAVPAAL